MGSEQGHGIPGRGVENGGSPDEEDQEESAEVADSNMDAGSEKYLDLLFEDEDEDDDESHIEGNQYDELQVSNIEPKRLNLEEILRDIQDNEIELVNGRGEPIKGVLNLKNPSIIYSDEYFKHSPFRYLSNREETLSEDHMEERWPGLQKWIEKHTRTKKSSAPPIEPGSKRKEATSCFLVRPAREQAVVFTAPFTMARFFQHVRQLYPVSPPGSLNIYVHFQDVEGFDRTGSTGGASMSFNGISLEEQSALQNQEHIEQWAKNFGPNVIDGEEIYIIIEHPQIILRDGRNLLNEIDYFPNFDDDTAEEMKQKFRLAVQALFTPKTAVDGQRRIRSVRMQVDRFKGEWLEWYEHMNYNAFVHDVIFKIDDSILNVYPSGWFPDRPFEEAEEKLRRAAKYEVESSPPQTPTFNEADGAYHARFEEAERRLNAGQERLREDQAELHERKASLQAAVSRLQEDQEQLMVEREKLSKFAQTLAQNPMSPKESFGKELITSCPVEGCGAELANEEGIVTQEALSSHYACHLVDRPGPSQTADELENQGIEHADLTPRICAMDRCHAKLHDMSVLQQAEHDEMHLEFQSRIEPPHQRCGHDQRCLAFLDNLTDEELKSHREMHSEIHSNQTVPKAFTICPHKNCLAHLEFLDDEERKSHTKMHASNRSSICSILGCKVKISKMTIEEIMQHFEDYHAPNESSKAPIQLAEGNQVPSTERKALDKEQLESTVGEPSAKSGEEPATSNKGLEKEYTPLDNSSSLSSTQSPSSSNGGYQATHDDAKHGDVADYKEPSEPSDVEDTQSNTSELMNSRGYSREEDKAYKWKYCNVCMAYLHSMGEVTRTTHLRNHHTQAAYTIFFASKDLALIEIQRRRERYGEFVDKHSGWFEAQDSDALPESSKSMYDRISRYASFLEEAKKKDKIAQKKSTKEDGEDKGKGKSNAKSKRSGKEKEKATTAKSKRKSIGRPKGKANKKGKRIEDIIDESSDEEGLKSDAKAKHVEAEHSDDNAQSGRPSLSQNPEQSTDEQESSSGATRATTARKTVPGTKRQAEEDVAKEQEEEEDDDDISSSSSSEGDLVSDSHIQNKRRRIER